MKARLNPGETFEFEGQELFAARTRQCCSLAGVRCFMDDNSNRCRGLGEEVPMCQQLIFLTRQQYLELRLMGEA